MRSLIVSLLVFTLALLGFDAVFLVDAGSRAAVTSPVSAARSDIGPGLHFKWPLVDRLDVVPARVMIDSTLRYTSYDGKELAEQAWMLARVESAARYANAIRKDPDAARATLEKALQAAAVPVLSGKTFDQLLADGAVATFANMEPVTTAAAALGLSVQQRGVGTLAMPSGSASANAVQESMQASQGVMLDKARTEAATAIEQASAQAAAERVRLLSEARSNAETLRAEGQAEAARILAEAASGDPSAAAFDRAAQAHRRARAAGQPVSADDPALHALRNTN